jgi:hypothetical protein
MLKLFGRVACTISLLLCIGLTFALLARWPGPSFAEFVFRGRYLRILYHNRTLSVEHIGDWPEPDGVTLWRHNPETPVYEGPRPNIGGWDFSFRLDVTRDAGVSMGNVRVEIDDRGVVKRWALLERSLLERRMQLESSGDITFQYPFSSPLPFWAIRRVPHWCIAVLFGLPPLVALLRRLRHRLLIARRRRSGLCTACGYNLIATMARCPECGTICPTRAEPSGTGGAPFSRAVHSLACGPRDER